MSVWRFSPNFGNNHTHPHTHSHTHTHAFTTQRRPVPRNDQRHGPQPPRSTPCPPNSPFAHACRDTHAISAHPGKPDACQARVSQHQPGPLSTMCVWVALVATTAARFQQGYHTRAHIHDLNTRTGVLQSCVCVCTCVCARAAGFPSDCNAGNPSDSNAATHPRAHRQLERARVLHR